MLKFFNGQDWVNLTNQRNGRFLTEKTLKDKFGGLNTMKSILSVDEIPQLDQRKEAALKLQRRVPTTREFENIPLQDLSTITNDLHVAVKEASQNTDLDMREFLGIDKALQRIQGEIANNTGKITEIDQHIKREHDKLKQAVTEDQKIRINDRLKNLNDERNVRLEISLQYREELQTQVSRIKQTLEKILDSDTSLAQKLRIIFREQGITLAAIFTAIGMIISTIVVALTGGGGGSAAGKTPPLKDTNKLKEWVKNVLQRLANALKRLAGKAAAALPGIIGSIVSAIITYLSKAVRFLGKNTWTFIVFIAGLIIYWLYEKLTVSSPSST